MLLGHPSKDVEGKIGVGLCLQDIDDIEWGEVWFEMLI